jgi:hypothetical protein
MKSSGAVCRHERITRRQFVAAALAAGAMASLPRPAHSSGTPVRLSLGEAAAKAVPLDYLGFSFETAQLADSSFFAADNTQLVSLFQALSADGVLRLGGNSSEFCWWKTSAADRPPELPATAHGDDNWMPHAFTAIEPPAIDRLMEFLEATGWKAIYGLNLGTGNPERDAEEAAYVAKRLGSRLLYFQIGNEPEYYRDANNQLRGQDWNFEKYLEQWMTFARAVIARVPEARFGGPDVGSNAQWVSRFAEAAPKALPDRIVACSSHYYVMGPPDNPGSTMERLLAPDPKVDRDARNIMNAADRAHIRYRMTEGNSCYRGGKPGVSNAFGSALWAADYLLKLADYGCAGVNLHGGTSQAIRNSLGAHLPGAQLGAEAAAAAAEGSFYTPIAGSREKGYSARPVFYGMKLAGFLCGGRMRPVFFDGPAANATARSAEMPDGSLRLLLLNKDPQQRLDMLIPSAHNAALWRLEAPSLAAVSNVTLAGAQMKPGKTWQPQREERLVSKNGQIRFEMAPASGAALFLENRG